MLFLRAPSRLGSNQFRYNRQPVGILDGLGSVSPPELASHPGNTINDLTRPGFIFDIVWP